MLLEAIGPPGRCRGGVVMIYWFRRPRFYPTYHPYAREGQAVVGPLLRGRSPTRCDRSRPNSTGVSGVLLSGISGSRVVPKNLARRSRRKTRRLLTNRPCSSLVYEESDSKERLRVSN